MSLSLSLAAPDEFRENEKDCAIEDGEGRTLFRVRDDDAGTGEETEGPDDPVLETVSSESVPASIEEPLPVPAMFSGSGGTRSSSLAVAAARRPFFRADLEDDAEKRPLAFGAEATRRMNLLMDFGVSREPDCDEDRPGDAGGDVG